MKKEPLTIAEMIKIMDAIEPLPFLGFTVTPAFLERLNQHPAVRRSTDERMPDGAMVVVVDKQIEDCLQWDDKAKMEWHIERTNLPC